MSRLQRARRLRIVGLATLIVIASVTLVPAATSSASSGHRPAILTSKAPGTLIHSQAVSAPGLDGTAYRVEYWSESVPQNKPVKVSGLVIVPTGPAPTGGWPVVTWAHPTDGMVGNCAPSLDPTTDVPFANTLLMQGWEITASDYLNENAFATKSKKLLPYLVGAEAARNSIDIVRAAQQMAAADASSNYQVWGWSEGGQTALWVSNITATYAPELTLKGSVASAPGTQLQSLFTSLETNTTYWPLLLMVAAGFNSTYGNAAAPLGAILTHTGKKLISSVSKKESQCISGVIETLAVHYNYHDLFLSPAIPPAWQTLLNENDPANFTVAGPAPVLIVHGSADTTAPPSTSASEADELCALNPAQPLERWLYSGLDHIGIIGTQTPGTANSNGNGDSIWGSSDSIGDIVQWMSDRFSDGSWPDPYTPTGNGATTVTQTNVC